MGGDTEDRQITDVQLHRVSFCADAVAEVNSVVLGGYNPVLAGFTDVAESCCGLAGNRTVGVVPLQTGEVGALFARYRGSETGGLAVADVGLMCQSDVEALGLDEVEGSIALALVSILHIECVAASGEICTDGVVGVISWIGIPLVLLGARTAGYRHFDFTVRVAIAFGVDRVSCDDQLGGVDNDRIHRCLTVVRISNRNRVTSFG